MPPNLKLGEGGGASRPPCPPPPLPTPMLISDSAGAASCLTRHGRRPELGLQVECPSSGNNAWLTILTFDLLINNCEFACSAHCFNARHFSSSVYRPRMVAREN